MKSKSKEHDLEWWRKRCIECKGMSEDLKKAMSVQDIREAGLIHERMREHINRTKYPQRHGFIIEITGRV